MDDLEINIAITYKVPKNNLTFNGLLRGLKIDRDAIMRSMIGQILAIRDRSLLFRAPQQSFPKNSGSILPITKKR